MLLCFGGWTVSFAAFLLWGIDRSHLGSFIDVRTGGKFIRDAFLRAGETDDERRIETITTRRSYWEDIEVDIKAWIAERWGGWRVKAPEWLTPSLITNIQDLGLLPPEHVSMLRQATNRQLLLTQLVATTSRITATTSRITPFPSEPPP